jgi:hypothetical protein
MSEGETMHSRYRAVMVAFTLVLGCGGGGGDTDLAGPEVPTPEGKPTALPTFGSLGLYAADAPINTKVPANATVDPNSDVYVAKIVQFADERGGSVIAYGQYSSTVFFATTSTTRLELALPCGPAWELGVSKVTGVPVPSFAEPANDVDGADNPVPAAGCGDASDQDNHMVVLDLAARCEYDMWQARKVNGKWLASWGNAVSLDGRGVYARGLSTRGSGLAFLGGVIWPDELKSGHIGHALVFSYPLTRDGGPVAPATESDGWSGDAAALPEGAFLRLDPSLDLSTLTLSSVELTVARALQEYGLYLVDDGGGIQFYAVDPSSVEGDPYDGLLPVAQDYLFLPGLPLDRLQVLTLPPQDPDFQDKLQLENNSCVTFG